MKPYALSLSVQYRFFKQYLYRVANQQMHTSKICFMIHFYSPNMFRSLLWPSSGWHARIQYLR